MPPQADTVRELFDRALALPEPERAAFLDAACDAGVRREVESLLAFHARAGEFLEEPRAFLPVRAVELERGARVGAFVVRERLGEGGMGVVYLAEQLAPVRRQVALKLLKASAESGEQAARFALESQALALMDHRNVARIHAAGTTDDARPFFAMEHVPGTPLSRYCDERELDVERRLRLFLDVCAGVEHAHGKGIVHRDLKPSNVLVREDRGVATPKIIDFGVAKALVRGLTDQTLRTSPGMVIGTLDYMSPEQALSEGRDVDARTDVYSLGAVLYELLIGCLPYEFRARRDLTIAAVHRAFAHEDPLPPSRRLDALERDKQVEIARLRATSPSALRALLARDLDWIVGKAIEKERARRYASAAELAADVERFLRHEPVLAKPPSVAYRARKFVRRNKLWVAIVVTLLAGLLATSWAAIDAWRARRRADRNLALIEEQRNHLLPLADYARWQSLRQEADRLWPAEPRMVPAMDDWIARTRELASRRAQHAALLATYDASHGVRLDVPAADRPGTELAGAEVDTYFALINRLVRGLERFEDASAPIGSLREMQARRDFASRIEHDSLIAPAQAWRAAVDAIAASALYGGLRIEPQLGLVPLGPDPATQLFEFAHLPSGAAPMRDEHGVLSSDEGTGLVLVLIPPSSDAPAFYIAKHALTRAQWNRMRGAPQGDDDPPLAFERADTAAVALALEHASLSPSTAEQRERAAHVDPRLAVTNGIRPARKLGP